jgi:hypothetical protein
MFLGYLLIYVIYYIKTLVFVKGTGSRCTRLRGARRDAPLRMDRTSKTNAGNESTRSDQKGLSQNSFIENGEGLGVVSCDFISESAYIQ